MTEVIILLPGGYGNKNIWEGLSVFKFIREFLKRLEAENSKTFGNTRLDCCNINKSAENPNKNSTSINKRENRSSR
jgi:hypothetical protein